MFVKKTSKFSDLAGKLTIAIYIWIISQCVINCLAEDKNQEESLNEKSNVLLFYTQQEEILQSTISIWLTSGLEHAGGSVAL